MASRHRAQTTRRGHIPLAMSRSYGTSFRPGARNELASLPRGQFLCKCGCAAVTIISCAACVHIHRDEAHDRLRLCNLLAATSPPKPALFKASQMRSFVSWKAYVCVHSCRCKVSDALRVRGRAQFDELQAAGPAAVLLQPDQRLLFAYRRPLPSSSSRQGEITSARTYYARPHTRPACLERAHTQPMRRLLAREPVLTAAVECVRVAAPRQRRALDGRATPWRAWHVRVRVYVTVCVPVPLETSSRMSCRRRKPRSLSLKTA